MFKLFSKKNERKSLQSKRAAGRRRLELEALEARWLPSTITINAAAADPDDGLTSPSEATELAQASDTINFAIAEVQEDLGNIEVPVTITGSTRLGSMTLAAGSQITNFTLADGAVNCFSGGVTIAGSTFQSTPLLLMGNGYQVLNCTFTGAEGTTSGLGIEGSSNTLTSTTFTQASFSVSGDGNIVTGVKLTLDGGALANAGVGGSGNTVNGVETHLASFG